MLFLFVSDIKQIRACYNYQLDCPSRRTATKDPAKNGNKKDGLVADLFSNAFSHGKLKFYGYFCCLALRYKRITRNYFLLTLTQQKL